MRRRSSATCAHAGGPSSVRPTAMRRHPHGSKCFGYVFLRARARMRVRASMCLRGTHTHGCAHARTHARTHGVRWRHLQVALHRAHVTRLEELELRTQPRDLALVSAAHAHFPQPHTRRWPNPRQTSTILTRTYASHHIASLIRDGADMDTSTPSSVRKACHARACECEEAELCARARARLWRAGRAVHAKPIGISRLDVMAQNSERSRAQCSGVLLAARQGKAVGAHLTRITCISLFVSTELITACTYALGGSRRASRRPCCRCIHAGRTTAG